MGPIYLVQRGWVERREGHKGLDGVIRLDYMGAAEFEWGALPGSLKAIRENAAAYVTKDTGLKAKNGRSLMVLCPTKDFDALRSFLERNSEKATDRLKEWLGLPEGLRCEDRAPDFWWDVTNHWMAVLGQKIAKVVFEVVLTKDP